MSKSIEVNLNLIWIKYSKVDKVYYKLVTEKRRIVNEIIGLEQKHDNKVGKVGNLIIMFKKALFSRFFVAGAYNCF